MRGSAFIVGAGIAGLSAAHALSQKGWETRVFDKTPVFREIGAGIQLTPNATRILRRLGLLDKIRSFASVPKAIAIRDGTTGLTFLRAPLEGFCERVYGAPYLHAYRPDFHKCLEEGLSISLSTEIFGYSRDGVMLTETSHAPCDLIIGADGLRSCIQQQMHGPQRPRFTHQVAWRGLIPITPDLGRHFQLEATIWVGKSQHVVTYFVRPDLLNFVAVTEQNDWREEGWNLPGCVGDLRSRFAGWHGSLVDLFQACKTVRRWALFDRLPLSHWIDGRVVLMGDAAHPTLPFLAQGAALAIEDAWALATYAPDLKAYECARRSRVTKLQAAARAHARLYHRTRWLDEFKLMVSRGIFRGPQAHALLWRIFSFGS